ncbi:MAG: hypothetical protein AAGC73_04505 [Verrucomicrobiota bacterium]
MKLWHSILFISALSASQCVNAEEVVPKISSEEAAAIVEADQVAKEKAKDEREAELRSAEILETSVADLGNKMVIFNRVKATVVNSDTTSEPVEANIPPVPELPTPELASKEVVSLALSGTVYDESISELWWDYEGVRYRIFTNANFLYFSGVGEIEDATTRYSLLMLVIGRSTSGEPSVAEDAPWRPLLSDFTEGQLEYYLMDWGDLLEPDPKALAMIETLLLYYAENSAKMKIAYENAQTIREAREAYLEANPPKKRDTIINFRPTGKSVSANSTQ